MTKCSKNLLKKHVAIFLILLPPLLGFSQTDSTRLFTIVSKLEKLPATNPIEKVYLHFNKPNINTDDTIWFKGYLVAGMHHQPSGLSGVLYVDLIDERDSIVKTEKLKITGATVVGDMVTDETIRPGHYRIRAYTNWMRNAGLDYFFYHNFDIADAKAKAVRLNSIFSQSGNQVDAHLIYTDKAGRAFNGKAVSYEIKAGKELLFKGSGFTDDQGILNISFPVRAASNAQIFSHIKLINTLVIDQTTPVHLASHPPDIQFFPESAQLLNGVRSKIAFKAIGPNGLGINIKGIVFDNDHKQVAEFASQHAGMGAFMLKPQKGKSYTAKITLTDSTAFTVNLPVAVDNGFVLSLADADSAHLQLQIATNIATLQLQHDSALYVVAQCGGKVYYTTTGKLNSILSTATIPKNKFPTGIVQFTLFSASGEPLNERVLFVQNHDELRLRLNTDKNGYTAKEKINMILRASNKDKQPVSGTFSVTVFNEDELEADEDAESTILSHILLSSDLKGYIETPNYYFRSTGPEISADLDVLMLTQGYHRFEWKEILNDHYPTISYHPEKTIGISGRLSIKGDKPVSNSKVLLLSAADKITIDTLSDADGRFSFPGVEFPDSTKLVIQGPKNYDSKDVQVTLDRVTPPPVINNGLAAATPNAAPPVLYRATGKADTVALALFLKQEAFSLKHTNKLNEVKIVARKPTQHGNPPGTPIVTRSDNLNGPGHADQILGAEQLQDCFNLANCLQAKIYGLTIGPNTAFIIDGVLTKNIDIWNNIPINNILTIEVLKRKAYTNIYGIEASYGAIVITTRHGNEGLKVDYASITAPGVITAKFIGYYKAKQFYTPKYNAPQSNKLIPDDRTAIYWNPNILTDKNGTCTLDFFNSDVKGSYRAVIEGIDEDGNIGRYVYRYKVQ